MDTIIHLILLTGVCFPSSCLLHRLLLVKEAETWENAQKYCREKCVDLVSPDDMEDMKAVLRAFQGGDIESVWMGLKIGETRRWHWSLTGKNLYKEGETNYIKWGSSDDSYNCAAFKDGLMYKTSCGINLWVICFNGAELGSERYVLIHKSMTWMGSRDFCRANYTDLASVRNEEESQILQQVAGDKKVWLGLFRDYWSSSDGTESSFRYWRPQEEVWDPGPPKCAASLMSQSGKWAKGSCDTTRPFLCNCATFRYVFKVKIRSQDAGLDVNDPSVQAQILEHMKQQLVDAGQTEVCQIQWRKNLNGSGVFIREPNGHG